MQMRVQHITGSQAIGNSVQITMNKLYRKVHIWYSVNKRTNQT